MSANEIKRKKGDVLKKSTEKRTRRKSEGQGTKIIVPAVDELGGVQFLSLVAGAAVKGEGLGGGDWREKVRRRKDQGREGVEERRREVRRKEGEKEKRGEIDVSRGGGIPPTDF